MGKSLKIDAHQQREWNVVGLLLICCCGSVDPCEHAVFWRSLHTLYQLTGIRRSVINCLSLVLLKY